MLKSLDGLGKYFFVLDASDKMKAFEIETADNMKISNIGVLSCLMRDVAIAFSHNGRFRSPPLPEVLIAGKGRIIGEQTSTGNIFYIKENPDEIVLPAMPFPEIGGKNVCSGSPSSALDLWLRGKMRVGAGDATLLLGFDL
jgi:hypothetical protein